MVESHTWYLCGRYLSLLFNQYIGLEKESLLEQREDVFFHLLESASEFDFDYAIPWQAVMVRLPIKMHFLQV